jgi:hypothetical protein
MSASQGKRWWPASTAVMQPSDRTSGTEDGLGDGSGEGSGDGSGDVNGDAGSEAEGDGDGVGEVVDVVVDVVVVDSGASGVGLDVGDADGPDPLPTVLQCTTHIATPIATHTAIALPPSRLIPPAQTM